MNFDNNKRGISKNSEGRIRRWEYELVECPTIMSETNEDQTSKGSKHQ